MWFQLAVLFIGAFAQHRASKAQAAEAEFQRRESLANAAQAAADEKLSQQIGEAEGVEALLAGEQESARARVSAAARGGRGDVGTNFILSLQNDAITEWEVFKANLGTRRRTERFGAESQSFIRQAFQLETKKANIKQAGRLGVATTILGGLGDMSSKGMFDRTTTTNAGGATAIGAGNRRAAGRIPR